MAEKSIPTSAPEDPLWRWSIRSTARQSGGHGGDGGEMGFSATTAVCRLRPDAACTVLGTQCHAVLWRRFRFGLPPRIVLVMKRAAAEGDRDMDDRPRPSQATSSSPAMERSCCTLPSCLCSFPNTLLTLLKGVLKDTLFPLYPPWQLDLLPYGLYGRVPGRPVRPAGGA